MVTDKIRIAEKQRFVLPRSIGEVVITDELDEEDIRAVLESARD